MSRQELALEARSLTVASLCREVAWHSPPFRIPGESALKRLVKTNWQGSILIEALYRNLDVSSRSSSRTSLMRRAYSGFTLLGSTVGAPTRLRNPSIPHDPNPPRPARQLPDIRSPRAPERPGWTPT